MTADPYSTVIAASRGALTAAGLQRREIGDTVYFAGGDGAETLLLIHGVNDQAGTWALGVAGLARRYRLLIPDLPGHGESGPKEGPLALPMLVERIHAIVEREVKLKVAMAGNSMGAWLALLFTLAHPDRVSRLYLESGGGLARVPSVPLVATSKEEAEKILRAVHGPEAKIPEWAADSLLSRSKDAPMHRVMASNVFPHFLDARLAEIEVPTTVIWGEYDGVVSRAYVEDVVKGIPGAKLHVIEKAGHIPHSQQPEKFVACLTETC